MEDKTRPSHEPDMTARQIQKELERQCVMFEKNAKINLRNNSFERMKQLTARVYPAIVHQNFDKFNGKHIQQFVNSLLENEKTAPA